LIFQVLFDFLASSLQRFIEKEGNDFSLSQPLKRELAFTFSFPVKQTSISSGVLIKWTKGFAISEMAGEDIAECLQGALNKRGLDIRVAALVSPLLLQKNHILGELLFHCNSFDDFPSRHKILMP
jgi:hexokinase